MKQSLILLVILAMVSFTSCKDGKFFGKAKEAKLKITALENENAVLKQKLAEFEDRQKEEILSIRSDYEQKLAVLQQKIEAGTAKEYSGYFVIVGSFKVPKNAQNYSVKMKQMGYEGKIVKGPNNYQLVTSGTYTTLKSSIEAMKKARSTVASEAWIYFN